mgnify:CR=1 FL=1
MLARLPTGCAGLDELLGGGVEPGALTLVYGEPGSGKTSLALQLSREVLNNGGKSVLFIDTEGLSMERLKQVCGDEALDGLSIAAPVDQVVVPAQQRLAHELQPPDHMQAHSATDGRAPELRPTDLWGLVQVLGRCRRPDGRAQQQPECEDPQAHQPASATE